MNVFFIIGNTAITPDLGAGTILAGVTRDSVIKVLHEMGLNVEERELSIQEIIEAHKQGLLREDFGTGTAATISHIKELRYKEYVMEFENEKWEVSSQVKNRMNQIRYGLSDDKFGWMYKI